MDEQHPLTPEELRWRAVAWDPEKARRNQKQQYILPGVWIVFTAAWIIAIALGADLFNWYVSSYCYAVISTASQVLSTTDASRKAEGHGVYND